MAAVLWVSTARADSVELAWPADDRNCAAEAAAVDADGRLLVACYQLYERGWRLTAYSPDGALVAERFVNGVGGEPTPVATFPRPEGMAVDDVAGVAYVAGALATGAVEETAGAVVAVALDDLRPVWTTVDPAVEVYGNVALAADGTTCAVGRSFNGTDTDLAISRFDANGSLLWTRTIDRGDDDAGTSSFQDVAVDDRGACYAVGNNVFARVNPDGSVAWVVERPALSLALQDDRYVVVSSPLVPRGQTALYDLDGNLVWETMVGGIALATADHGDVWFGRNEFVGSSEVNWQVGRIADHGELLWLETIGQRRQDLVQDLVVGDDDSLYAAGQVTIPGGLFNRFWVQRGALIKFDPNGDQKWRIDEAAVPGPRNLVASGDDRLYVTGLAGHAAFDHKTEEEPPRSCPWWNWICRWSK